MSGPTARQRLGVVAHRVGQPAVLIKHHQPVRGVPRKEDAGVGVFRQIVGEACRPGCIDIRHAGTHRQRLRQVRDTDRLPPAHRVARLHLARRDWGRQKQGPQQIRLCTEISGKHPQAQSEHRIAAHAGGKLRLCSLAPHQMLQRFCHHAGGAETSH